MNHPSEWARFFDVNTGRYRYKHKGSGIIRDTFMTIGKIFKKKYAVMCLFYQNYWAHKLTSEKHLLAYKGGLACNHS